MEVWAPGRVNLMGEHTDYAGGLVLPIAIQLGIALTAAPASRIGLVSDGERAQLAADGTGNARGWGRYVAAVAQELGALGRPAVGIDGRVEADLPRGAGLGSSGALEVVLGLALCAVAQFPVEPLELALACQRAERRAVGVPSGVLDQAASLLGRAGHALLLDCGTLEHEWVEVPLEIGLAVVDSGERRAHESSGYAERRRELEAGDPRRLRHVTGENDRVRAAVRALRAHDLAALAEIFAASHASLRDDYEVSTPTLDALVETALAAGAFAARLTGGGFGGAIVALVERERADDFLRRVLRRTRTRGWIVQAADGAIRYKTDSPPGRA
jgi:galactokinase